MGKVDVDQVDRRDARFDQGQMIVDDLDPHLVSKSAGLQFSGDSPDRFHQVRGEGEAEPLLIELDF